jgi:hypothetical protein
MQGMGKKAEANAQADQLRQNALFLRQSAADAESRGRHEADWQRNETQQLIGTQRTTQAASGGVVDEGSNALIQQDTAQLGELDALTISNNAAREAYGYNVEATSNIKNSIKAKAAGKNAVISSVVGGALGGMGGGGGGMGGLFGGGAGAGTKSALATNTTRLNSNQGYA